MLFDRKRPGVLQCSWRIPKGAPIVGQVKPRQRNVADVRPETVLRPNHRRDRQINSQHQHQGRREPEQAPQIEFHQVDLTPCVELVDEESGDQETAENEENIDTKVTCVESGNPAMICDDQRHRDRS